MADTETQTNLVRENKMNDRMINKSLLERMKDDIPKMNPDVAGGMSRRHLNNAAQYIDMILKSVLVGLPDFKYKGMTPVTPQEEFAEVTRPRHNKRTYDMARSDTYMVRLNFEFKGKIYSRYMSLPFVGEGGTMYLRGTKYVVSPVLADRVISITPPNIFVRLLRDRLNFSKMPHFYFANVGATLDGKHTFSRETVSVVYSTIYKQKENLRNKSKTYACSTNLVFYLLCKYGLRGMFRTFPGIEIKVIDITKDEIPSDDWVVCKSTGDKPKSLNKPYYVPSNIGICIRRSEYTETVKALVAGFFYVLDHFSEEMAITEVDNTMKWCVYMGKVLWGHEVNTAKLHADLSDHINSLDNYIDEVMRIQFREIGMEIDNIYQMFYVIIDKFNEWQMQHINNEANLYNKAFGVLYYVLLKNIEQIVIFYFKMVKDSKKGELTESDVVGNLARKLSTSVILSMYKGPSMMMVVSSASDNMIPRITQNQVPQVKTNRTNRGSSGNTNINAPEYRVHVSVAEAGALLTMSKASPDGTTHLNPYLQVDQNSNMIVRHKDLQPLLDEVQEFLTGGRTGKYRLSWDNKQ